MAPLIINILYAREKIRKDGYVYIDKTALIYQLVSSGSYYFLSRPRRFGKSLLISTLEAYFQGKRELFEGLAMEKLEKNWVKRPVLHLDLNIGKYDTPDSLDKIPYYRFLHGSICKETNSLPFFLIFTLLFQSPVDTYGTLNHKYPLRARDKLSISQTYMGCACDKS